MASPLVECIPNFSEARRPEVIEQIMQAIGFVPGVTILDRHSDLDHNRTVITYVGTPQAVEEAAYQAIAKAAQLIDLQAHSGEHPRIGATDVVPFVPIRDVSMLDCVEMARRLGKRVGQGLNIPVYLYEEASSRPDRQNLENIRRGQFEGLKTEIKTNPERFPDFGPHELGPAGATVIGARQPLIAFNVFLTSNDVSIAQKIARAVRNSSGGLRFLKAMGVLVDGRAQVSMNLTNFRQTPVARVVEMVRREAARFGVSIHHSELVGLIPQEALFDAATWYVQLDDFKTEQVLEQRLYDNKPLIASTPALAPEPSFLDRLAAGTPAPGGGSATAFAGAAAAALVGMVARLTVGKEIYAGVEAQMWALIEKADRLRTELNLAVEEDASAFEALMQASRLPKNTPEEQHARAISIEKATLGAIAIPLRVANRAVAVLDLAVQAASFGNLNAISDAGSAAALARACLSGAGLNVQINAAGLQDQAKARLFVDEVRQLHTQAVELEGSLQKALAERANIGTGEIL
jgi:glutamate formiminotransferase/formiminotetrahydrofolate cyclodeaminase